jgi:hypothetical protein
MVAAITTPHSLQKALNYNEKKVERGQAQLIHAGNFLQLPEEMNFYDKLERFEKQMELNQRAQTKTLHVSLNFHPSETEKLTQEKLVELAGEYMQRIGFGKQPYLVYQHHDAGHPHLHIVTTTILENGKRINTHELGKKVSSPITRQLEKEYGLVRAEKRDRQLEQQQSRAINTAKVEYGKSETRRSITNVLDTVIDRYKYTSLAELNAVLKRYNVMADRGTEESRTYQHRGLHYRILDGKGQKIGVPIKASLIHSKPTLNYLEQKFQENELKREPDQKRLKNTLDYTMLKNPKSLDEWVKALEKERVSVAVRRSEKGKVYGLTYIDHQTMAVFNGSDLGKEYAAKRILEKLGIDQSRKSVKELQQEQKRTEQQEERQQKQSTKTPPQKQESGNELLPGNKLLKEFSNPLEQVMQPEESNEQLAYELREEQMKKRKQRGHSHER